MPQLRLNRELCHGCRTCEMACRDSHGLSALESHLTIEKLESGRYPHPKLSYRLHVCRQCKNAVCEAACPVGAIAHGSAVCIDEALCIGCGACAQACPFHAVLIRSYTHKASKCDLCQARLADGKQPVCVSACVMRCLYVD